MKGELAIIGLLKNDSAVNAIIAGRVFPLEIPEQTIFPAIFVEAHDDTPYDSASGVSKADVEIVNVLILYESLDRQNNYAKLIILGDAVRSALDYKNGTTNGVTYDQIRFTNSNTFNDMQTNKKVFINEQTYEVCVKR